MPMMFKLLPLLLLVFSCSIISDSDLKELPEEGYTKNIIITRSDNSQVLTGSLTYEGGYSYPTKITIDWSGSLQLFRIPITATKKIIRTIFEFSDGRVTKITNINEDNVTARTDEFTYAQGILSKHVLKEIDVSGQGDFGSFSFENLFFYNADGGVDFVAQTRCNLSGCYNGVFQYGAQGYSATKYYGFIPVTLVSNPQTQGYQYTTDANTIVSEFNPTSIYLPSASSYFFTEEAGAPEVSPFGLPFSNSAGSYSYGKCCVQVDKGNSEYLLHLYYRIAEWINKDKPLGPDPYWRQYEDTTYGSNNTAWIFPRLTMAIDYSNYVNGGGLFETSSREFAVDFVNEVAFK